MSTRYAFFYLRRDDASGIPGAVPDHVAHWRGLDLGDYLGGPFQDRTGGLITFRTETVHRAEQAVATDPFILRGLLDAYWLKPWTPE